MTKKKNKTKEYLITEEKPDWNFLWIIVIGITIAFIGVMGSQQTFSDEVVGNVYKEGLGFAHASGIIAAVTGGMLFFIGLFLICHIPQEKQRFVKMEESK